MTERERQVSERRSGAACLQRVVAGIHVYKV